MRSTALDLIAGLDRRASWDDVEPASPKAQPLTSAELRDFLERIRSWDSAAWLAHRERYRRAYGPLPFLPPECQNAVVLQATRGPRHGGRLWGLGGERGKLSFDLPSLQQHANDVAALWGRRLLQSRILFLAGSDVLHQPVESVRGSLDARIGQTIPDRAEDARSTARSSR